MCADGQSGGRKPRVGFGDRRCAEVEDAGGEHRAGMAFGHPGDEMVEGADAAARDDRDADRIRDRAGERGVVAVLRAVAVHRGDEQFAGRSEEHTSELQSLMRISYAVFCLKKTLQTRPELFSLFMNTDTMRTELYY